MQTAKSGVARPAGLRLGRRVVVAQTLTGRATANLLPIAQIISARALAPPFSTVIIGFGRLILFVRTVHAERMAAFA